jgi:zinc protease
LYHSSGFAKYKIGSFVLKNGLMVVCIEKKTAPILFFSIWYRCGSICDAISRSGVAHFLEHMAFNTDKMTFDHFLEDNGAQKNAFTSRKTICFYEIFPKECIETVCLHEANRQTGMQIDDEVFMAEKRVIQEERGQNVDNDPDGAQTEAVLATIFNRRNGGIAILGWKHEIEAISPRDLLDFHGKWFAPNNAVIVISGDFNLASLKECLERHFGINPPKDIPQFPLGTRGHQSNCQKEIHYGSPKNGFGAAMEEIYHAPSMIKGGLRKTISLYMLIGILNQSEFFIKKTLKDILNCASGVSFQYVRGEFASDIVCVHITAHSIDHLNEAEAAWKYLRQRLLQVGITREDLDIAKQQYRLSLAHRDDDIESMSNYIGWLLTRGYSLEEIQSIDNIVQDLSVEECNDLLREIFSTEPHAIARTLPKGYDRE